MSILDERDFQKLRQATSQAELEHAQLYLDLARAWNAQLNSAHAPQALNEMDDEINNITLAFQRTANQPDSLEIARDLALALFRYFDKRSLWDDWIHLSLSALQTCQQLGDAYSMEEAYPQLCNDRGIAYRMLSQQDNALHWYEQALAHAVSDELRSDALTNMADIYRLQGNTEQAVQAAHQAIELGRRANDINRQAKGLEYLGLTCMSLRQYDAAVDHYTNALHLREETGNLPRIALVLTFLSYALTQRGVEDDYTQALTHYKRAYEIDIKLQDWQSIARYQGDVAALYNKLGAYQKAIDNAELALDRNDRIGFWRGVALNHMRLTESHMHLNHLDKALFHANQAFRYRAHLSDFDRKLSQFDKVFLQLAQNLLQLGQTEKAIEYSKIALEIAQDTKDSTTSQAAIELLQQLEAGNS
jgi:tetratricopeptide (TPR) repeat protein